MAHFRWLLRSGCMAMQLALCLLMGLRLVFASIVGSDCRRSARTPASHHVGAGSLDATALPSNGNLAGLSRSSEATSKQQDDKGPASSECTLAEAKSTWLHFSTADQQQLGVVPGHIGLKLPASDQFSGAYSMGRALHARQAISVLGPSVDPSSSWSPGSTDQSISGDSSDDQDSTSEETDAGSYSPPTTSSVNASSNLGSSSSSFSSSKRPSPTSPSSAYQQSLSSAETSLPNIDSGGSHNTGSSNTAPSVNTTSPGTNTTISNTNTIPQPSHQTANSRLTTAIAVGITIPVLVIGMGLMALAWLYKRRQRASPTQTDQDFERKTDEETAGVTTLGMASHTELTHYAAPKVETVCVPSQPLSVDQKTPEETVPDAGQSPHLRGSDERPDTSRLTGASSQVESSVVTSESPRQVPRTSGTPSDSSQSVGATSEAASAPATTLNRKPTCARARSLKRKPVPPLIDSQDAPAKMKAEQ